MNSWFRRCNKNTDGIFWKSRWDVWWTMLPKDKYLGYIAAATGLSFGLLLTLFLGTKILKATVTYVVNRYTISLTNLMDLAQSVTAMGSFKTEVTRCKYKVQVSFYHYFKKR